MQKINFFNFYYFLVCTFDLVNLKLPKSTFQVVCHSYLLSKKLCLQLTDDDSMRPSCTTTLSLHQHQVYVNVTIFYRCCKNVKCTCIFQQRKIKMLMSMHFSAEKKIGKRPKIVKHHCKIHKICVRKAQLLDH